MSFVRVRRTSAIPRKKKPIRRKPVWDDTVNDLTALKATPEEIEYRKASHQSKHALAARLQKQKDLQKKTDLSISNAEARQLAIMREVLYDQHQFQSAIAKSDKMMSSVKDMFGDDPKRFTGFPHVTAAPDPDGVDRTASLVAEYPDIQTRMEALSQSLMDGSALNDFETDSDDEAVAPDPITYQPQMNMERFERYLAHEEKNNTLSTISGQAQLSQLAQGPIQSTQIQDTASLHTSIGTGYETPKKNPNESVSILKTPKSAINDTKKIKKTRKRVAPPKSPQHNTSAFNLTDLRKVLENLQDEIAEFEKQTGRQVPAERHRQETFSGYTLSLVDSVTKLSRYLKENDLRLKAEMMVREQLMQDVSQLAALIDALTSDIILTQDESAKLKNEFTKYKLETQSEIQHLKAVLHKAGLMEEEAVLKTPPRGAPPPPSHTESGEDAKQPQEISAIPNHVQSASAAVLLSPPVRKSHLHKQEEDEESTENNSITADEPAPVSLPNNSSYFPVGGVSYLHGPVSSNPSRASSVDSHSDPTQLPNGPGLHPTTGARVIRPNLPSSVNQGLSDPQSDPNGPQQVQGVPWYPQSQFLQSLPPGNPPQSLASSQVPSVAGSSLQGNSLARSSASYPGPLGGQGMQGRPYLTTNAARVAVPRPIPLVQSNVEGPLHNGVRPSGQVPEHLTIRPGMTQSLGGQSGISYPMASQISQGGRLGLYSSASQSGSLGGSGQDQRHLAHTSGLPAPPSYNSKDVLAAQILELNKQHEEAQARLQLLMQQQQNQHQEHLDQHHTLQETDNELRAAVVLGQRNPQQHGLPSHPVSPPISPISQKSDNYLSLQGLTQQNNLGSASSRGITVSIPSMSLDSTNESSPSPKRA
ncbi:spindle and centriole-associated protein 1-like [Ylistrum balloti]|uniref:spindle and centriole-associated protein 1-like n=1 Tax=Ylistrum balloti TaxID=509963 RepID=UPI002905C944|nr:spindle and centriole-associated protein 1-like [Ylistrum balloti]